MSARATSVNPAVLRWARERSGLTIEEAAKRIQRHPEDILAWEAGTAAPTYSQLKRLAAKAYKRPIALFFFPEPPEEKDLRTEFRTLPASELASLLPDTLLAIRETQARQAMIRELMVGRDTADRMLTNEVRPRANESPAELAHRVREFLGVSIQQQQGWSNHADALKNWRRVVEDAGVFTFKRPLKQTDISGFCLFDPQYPAIVINSSTSLARQEFTLFHELGHLLFSTSGVTKQDLAFTSLLNERDRAIEMTCNQFAAEMLLPQERFPWYLFSGRPLAIAVSDVAKLYKVSREVVLRRLLDSGRIEAEIYNELVDEWNREFLAGREEGGGGSYYLNQVAYMGSAYLDLVLSRYHAGNISLPDAADYLGVKAVNVGKLVEAFSRNG